MTEWIDVDDRLPGFRERVLCVIGAGWYVDILFYVNNCFYNDGVEVEKVTHWAPLPETPSQRRDDG